MKKLKSLIWVISLTLVFLSGCTTQYNPATRKEEFYIISSDREVGMGRSISKQVEKKYEVIEPQLSDEEWEILDFVEQQIIDEIDYDADEIEHNEEKKQKLHKSMTEVMFHSSINVDPITKEKIFYYVVRDLLGYGKIHVMMVDPFLEDVSCDGFNVPIFVYHRKHLSIASNIMFTSRPASLPRL